MKQLFIFVEEPSVEEVIDIIVPQIIEQDMQYRIFPHQGKDDLRKALKTVVPSISRIPGSRILIIHDQDDKECKEVKKQLVDIVGNKSSSPIVFRIICHELECWFLGDMDAIEKAFPRFKAKYYKNKRLYRNVDNITNAPQILRQIIPEYKNKTFLPKIETSRKIAPYLSIDRNNSLSFKHFILGVNKLIAD